MTELWSDEVLARCRTAARRAAAMRELTADIFPATVDSDGTHDSWPLLGWGLLARASGTLESIMGLFPRRRATDAGALSRVLFDHVLTLAWIGIDPADHSREWLRWERKQRLKADNDLQDQGGEPLLDEQVRRDFEGEVAEGPMMPDSIVARTTEVDAYWPTVTHVIEPRPTDARSFRQMYRALFRYDSRVVHPTISSVEPFVVADRSSRRASVMLVEQSPETVTLPFTRAVSMYALALLLSEHIFGLAPIEARLDDIFSNGVRRP